MLVQWLVSSQGDREFRQDGKTRWLCVIEVVGPFNSIQFNTRGFVGLFPGLGGGANDSAKTAMTSFGQVVPKADPEMEFKGFE